MSCDYFYDLSWSIRCCSVLLDTIIDLIVGFLCVWGLQGLFRVAPSASKLKKLKASLDCGVVDVQEYSSDPHAIAGAVNNANGSVLLQSFHDNHL